MVDPNSVDSIDAFTRASESLAADYMKLVKKRVRKCKGKEAVENELTAQFVLMRAVAEFWADKVVTEGNAEFLREIVDGIDGRFGLKI